VRWYYEEACSSSFLLIGVVLPRGPEWPWMYGPLPVGDRDGYEKCGKLIRPNYALENLLYWRNINSLVLTYAPGVSVFPATSGFTPGWVYVHAGGGHTLLSLPCSVSHFLDWSFKESSFSRMIVIRGLNGILCDGVDLTL